MTAEVPQVPGDEPAPDDLILERILQRSEQGIRDLIARHAGHVKALLLKKYGNHLHTEVEDAVTDAIATAWYRAREFDRTRGTLRGWLYGCARNALRLELRRQQLSRLSYLPGMEGFLSSVAADAPSESKQRLLGQLADAIDRLSPLQRTIILRDLADGDSVDNNKLAEECRTTVNSIHVSRNKARKRLGRLLGGKKHG